MPKFDEVQSEYNLLINTKCEFYLEDDTIVNLIFENSNLPHLLGFQYFSDAHSVFREFNDRNNTKVTADNVMSILKTKNITFEYLHQHHLIDPDKARRITEFTYNNIISLLRGVNTFKFIYDPKRSISDKSNFVFIEQRKKLFIQLYIGFDKKGKYYFPLSFQPSEKKEVSLERKPKKILKTIINHNTGESNYIEILDHVKMKPIINSLSNEIKDYKKKNNLLYQKLQENKDTKGLLPEVNKHILNITEYYNQLSSMTNIKELFMHQCHEQIKNFLDIYPKRFNKH